MEKATLKQNIIREIVIALVCILIAISSTAFGAAKTTKTNLKGKGTQEKTKRTALTADELALFKLLEKEHQAEQLEIAKISDTETINYKKVLVYDMAGTLLQEQDSQKAAIDLLKLPKGAKLLTVDDDLAIYIVL
ncbi:MAG: hypothetical protein ACPGJS_03280 [Flammeovirgaceae bacterium]